MASEAEFKAVAIWALTGETGSSSECIAAHLLGLKHNGSYPHDGADFGRCEGLLNAVPSFRDRLTEMASVNAYWAALVPRWNDIKSTPNQYAAIKAIVRPIEDADRNVVRIGDGMLVRF